MTATSESRRMDFERFMEEVDRYIAKRLGGLNSMDLPDYCYRDAHDDGMTPSATARAAMRAAGGEEFC